MKNKNRKNKSKPPSKQIGLIKTLTVLPESFASVYLSDSDPGRVPVQPEIGITAGSNSETAEDQSTTCSSSDTSLLGSGFGSEFGENPSNGVLLGKKKKKKVVAVAGTVSTMLGKDYVRSTPLKKGGGCFGKQKGWFGDGGSMRNGDDAEQFLCAMLGNECELSLGVVSDVLCQCGYSVEKALDALLELSASSGEQPKNDPYCDDKGSTKKESQVLLESSGSLTHRASDSTSQFSENKFQDNRWSVGSNGRNYFKVLTSSEVPSSTSHADYESEIPQKVLESLFNMPRPNSCEHEPRTMNWRNVVKKMESLGQKFESCPYGNGEPQQHIYAKGDEYHAYRETAKQHWNSMKSYYQKAATAYTNGERDYAAYLSEQGRVHNKMAREADEKASQDIFKARNTKIENVITIDLHGQHVKQAMRLLKLHLLFGAYVRSVQSFRVITGCGSHGVGKSKLKQSVTNLLEKESIEWSEENRGTLLIRLDGQTQFDFLDTESDSE